MEISVVQKNFLSYSYSYPELFSSDIYYLAVSALMPLVSFDS